MVPILVEKSGEQLIHGHLTDAVDVEIGENAGYIIQQNFVASDDIEPLRLEFPLVIVQDVGDSVHGYRGLSGSGTSLYQHIMFGIFTYYFILFLLDGGDYLA